jgi:hypothetical protein
VRLRPVGQQVRTASPWKPHTPCAEQCPQAIDRQRAVRRHPPHAGLTTVYGGTLELGTNAQAPALYGLGADIQGGKIVFDYTSTDLAATISADMDCQAWPSSITSTLIHDTNGLTVPGKGPDRDVRVARPEKAW